MFQIIILQENYTCALLSLVEILYIILFKHLQYKISIIFLCLCLFYNHENKWICTLKMWKLQNLKTSKHEFIVSDDIFLHKLPYLC